MIILIFSKYKHKTKTILYIHLFVFFVYCKFCEIEVHVNLKTFSLTRFIHEQSQAMQL